MGLQAPTLNLQSELLQLKGHPHTQISFRMMLQPFKQ